MQSSSEVLSVLLFVYQGKVGMKTKEKNRVHAQAHTQVFAVPELSSQLLDFTL